MTGVIGFRKDIQGLRGLAITLVVLEHATPYFQGGYVGVDVFFVISGFLITKILLGQIHEHSSISLNDFYSRRVRRLLPALTLVLISTMLISVFVLSPGLEQDKTVVTAIASFFFAANIHYLLQGGYFFLQSDPLRHLCSLGVEEQFYFFYPVLIIVVLRCATALRVSFTKLLFWVLLTITTSSFATSALLSMGATFLPLQSRLSFFGTPFRLWELMLGGILALVPTNKLGFLSGHVSKLLSVIGLSLILWPAVSYTPFTVFPGTSALPPVFGAFLVILSGSNGVKTGSIISAKPLIFLGDISYGLYLWHWPLIVFSERLFPGNHSFVLISVLVSVFVSAIQLNFLENPLRAKTSIKGRKALRFSLSSLVGMLVVAMTVSALSRSGLGINQTAQYKALPRFAENCSYERGATIIPPACNALGNGVARVLLIGDSQAGALGDGFVAAAEALDATYGMVYNNSCPVHARPNELRETCQGFLKALPSLITSFDPTVVVVANASDLYVSRGGYGRPDTQIRMTNGSFPRNYKEALGNWTTGLVDALTSPSLIQRPLIYVQMIPVPSVQGQSLLRDDDSISTFSLSSGFDRNYITRAERMVLSGLPGLQILDPADVLCPNNNCAFKLNSQPLYADQFHLNTRGSQLLSEQLTNLIRLAISP